MTDAPPRESMAGIEEWRASSLSTLILWNMASAAGSALNLMKLFLFVLAASVLWAQPEDVGEIQNRHPSFASHVERDLASAAGSFA